ncbi:MAG TPA: hypothetical protein VMD02_00735 [Candidatus Omnitrophota bacterium]|nr:hypothetical protein [Candidatus Omnitrophota bacterium]
MITSHSYAISGRGSLLCEGIQAHEVHIINYAQGSPFDPRIVPVTIKLARQTHFNISGKSVYDILAPEDVRNKCSLASALICQAAMKHEGLFERAGIARGYDVPGLSNAPSRFEYHDIALLRAGEVEVAVDVTTAQFSAVRKGLDNKDRIYFNSTQVLMIVARPDKIYKLLPIVYNGGRWAPI